MNTLISGLQAVETAARWAHERAGCTLASASRDALASRRLAARMPTQTHRQWAADAASELADAKRAERAAKRARRAAEYVTEVEITRFHLRTLGIPGMTGRWHRRTEVFQGTLQFPNGYTASVILGPGTYGFDKNLYELAILSGGRCVYDTGITDDVLGYLTPHQVRSYVEQISELEAR